MVPRAIDLKVASFRGNAIQAAVAKRVPQSDLESNLYGHLGITWNEDGPNFSEDILPDPSVGRWSKTNVHGYEVVRKDLPMITRTFEFEVPNWGDWYNGSHSVTQDRQVYPRDLIPPRNLGLKVSLLGTVQAADRLFVFRFAVDDILDRTNERFEAELLYDLNLLQENVGAADVFEPDATVDDFLRTLFVTWELLPPGERDSNIATIVRNVGGLNATQRAQLVERYDLLAALGPRHFIAGTSGFRRYFGAYFEDDLVVFENVEYGNAIYVMGEQWETLSRLSRTELLERAQRDFERIPHVEGWQHRIRALVAERRRRR